MPYQCGKGRLKELIRERGEEVVSAVIYRSLDYAEEMLREFFSDIPDGTWHGEIFLDGERVGSDRIHRICVKLDKKGSDLYFDYTGTAPRAGRGDQRDLLRLLRQHRRADLRLHLRWEN